MIANTILVTAGSGFVSSGLIRELHEDTHAHIVVLDNLRHRSSTALTAVVLLVAYSQLASEIDTSPPKGSVGKVD